MAYLSAAVGGFGIGTTTVTWISDCSPIIDQTVHNLTISGIHTYYVTNGDTPSSFTTSDMTNRQQILQQGTIGNRVLNRITESTQHQCG